MPTARSIELILKEVRRLDDLIAVQQAEVGVLEGRIASLVADVARLQSLRRIIHADARKIDNTLPPLP